MNNVSDVSGIISEYPDYTDTDFSKILNKYEFNSNDSTSKKSFIYQDPSQLLLRNYISKSTVYDNVLLYHLLGTGKCHEKDTPILMFDGTIKMVQDVKVGEYLMGDDSTPRKVLSLARGMDMMYDIIPVKGEKYTVNKEHILCLKASGFPKVTNDNRNNNYQVEWIQNNRFNCKTFTYNTTTKENRRMEANIFCKSITNKQILEVSVQDYLQISNGRKAILKGYKTGIKFSSKEVPFDPYILGYWLGDGTERGPTITTQDSTVLHYMYTVLPLYKLYLSKLQASYCYGITGDGKVGGNLFLNTLKNLKLINNKHIPHIYKCNDRQTRLKLLAGILDADGHYADGGFELTQSIKHEALIDDVIYLARSLGFACYKNLKKTSWTYKGVRKTGEAWRILINGTGIEEIPTVIPRKKAKPRKQIKDALVTGITVKEKGRGEYYGFTLDGNCRYLMGDFTVTHNTCASISIAEGFKEYITNMGRRIVVLVKNKNIQRNFMNELLGPCTKNEYLSDEERDLYFGNVSSERNTGVQQFQISIQRRELINRVHRLINKSYQFITYGTFVNRVLGAKDYERDELGRNTTKVKRVDGKLQRKRPKDEIKNFSNSVIIVDEAHNVTNNDVYLALHQVLSRSYNTRLVLLTATPMYDNPKEIFELANLLNANKGELQLPIRNELFKPYNSTSTTPAGPLVEKVNSDYINGNVLKGGIVHITELGKSVLTQALLGRVSYLQSNTDTNPRVNVMGKELIPGRVGTTKVVYCRMSNQQYLTYLQALKADIKSDSKYDLSSVIQNTEAAENVTETTSVSKTSSLYKNSSDAATMSYPGKLYGKDGFLEVFEKSNNGGYRLKSMYSELLTSELKQYSAKLYNLLQNIHNSPGNVFVYTNFVSFGGTSLLRLLLSANGYREFRSRNTETEANTFVVFDESTNIELREKYRRIFNSPENKHGKYIKVLIGSPIISEGITLKNVRQVHILEPSWNMSRINQIIGRAVRNMSHFDLPDTDRTVDVFKYVSIYKPSDKKTAKQFEENRLLGFSVDREKYILSEEKDRANKQVERLLKTIAFDCQLMKGRNVKDHAFDGSPECDYINCDFNCEINMETSSEPDKSTYNLGLATFEKFDIEFVLATLRDLFQKYFIWTLNDIVEYIHGIEPRVSNEVIFYTLGQITENKSPFTDMYGRDGFIINKGEFYIFNSSDIDVNSSLYSKYLDFTVDKNKYTLEQFTKAKLDISLSSDTNTNANTKTKKSKPKPVATKLSASDLRYNERIIENNDIFGTFRQRGTVENPYGPADEKFRIVDKREKGKGKGKNKSKSSEDTSSDNRKKLSGMWIGSFEKGQLIEIAKHLGIQAKLSFKEYDKVQLGKMIQKYLIDTKLVLK